MFDYVIVGAGFAGSTMAERLASQLGKRVLLVDKRPHIAGNAYDYINRHGLMVKKYGPHIFHTKSKEVWDYLCQFTEWNGYIHRVIAKIKNKEFYLPINIETMEKLYNREFTPETLRGYFEKCRLKIDKIRNSRDVIVSQVGEDLYDLFFKNYTKKQWGVYPEELDAQVTGRLPVRFDRDTRYFIDPYQGIPVGGYTKMFEKMLGNKNIFVMLNSDYKKIVNSVKFKKMIYTGPIDYFFDCNYGKLPYRSLEFKFKTFNIKKFQNGAVVNYPNEKKFTRITEFKYFYMQKHNKTTICYEYAKSEGAPYYPIPKADCQAVYSKYKRAADKLKNVYFLGRLAEYKYLNMDQVVEKALNLFNEIKYGH